MNMYKEHMDKTKVWRDEGLVLGMAGVGGSGWGKIVTTVLEQ